MNLALLITFFLVCFVSLFVFFMVNKNISHVTDSHLRILGIENKTLVKTRPLLAVRIIYFMTTTSIIVAAFFFLTRY